MPRAVSSVPVTDEVKDATRPRTAATWFRKAARREMAFAQLNLAIDYSIGEGLPQDYGQAAAWFRKAADQGNVKAQYGLACIFQRPRSAQSYASSYFGKILPPHGQREQTKRHTPKVATGGERTPSRGIIQSATTGAKWFAEHARNRSLRIRMDWRQSKPALKEK